MRAALKIKLHFNKQKQIATQSFLDFVLSSSKCYDASLKFWPKNGCLWIGRKAHNQRSDGKGGGGVIKILEQWD